MLDRALRALTAAAAMALAAPTYATHYDIMTTTAVAEAAAASLDAPVPATN